MPTNGRSILDESIVSDAYVWLMYLRSQHRNLFATEVRPSIDLAELMRHHWTSTEHSELRAGVRRAMPDVIAARRAEMFRLGLRNTGKSCVGKVNSILNTCGWRPRWRRQGRFASMDLRYTDGSELAEETGVVDALDVPAWDMWVSADEREHACKIVCWVPAELVEHMERAIHLCPTAAIQWE